MTESQLELFAEDSPAKIFLGPGPERDCEVSDLASGLSTTDSFTRLSLNTQLLKMSEICAVKDLQKLSKALPPSGMTANGKLLARQMQERPISETEFGSLPIETGHLLSALRIVLCATAARNHSALSAQTIIQTALAQGHIQKNVTDGELKKKIGGLLPTLTCQDAKNNAGPAQYIANELYSGWEVIPDFLRVDDGFPGRVDSIKQLGNAVVPQIPEIIGRAIMGAEA